MNELKIVLGSEMSDITIRKVRKEFYFQFIWLM